MITGTPGWATWGSVDGQLRRLEAVPGAGLRADGEPVEPERVERAFVDHLPVPASRCPTFPQPAGYGPATEPVLRVDVEAELAGALHRLAPEGWQRVSLSCAALGERIAVSATAVVGGAELSWIAPHELVEWLRRHRVLTYTPDTGAWSNLVVEVADGGERAFAPDHEPPRWPRETGDEREYFDELRHLPRTGAPEWLLAPAIRYHREQLVSAAELPGPVRMAPLFDGRDSEGRPQVFRPVITASEKAMLAEYLWNGHVVLSARSTSEDEVDPSRPPEVPKVFCTDGVWAWPLSMAHYLEHHDITPPAEFLDHVRRHAHRVPSSVAAHAIDQAKALVLGTDAYSVDGGYTENTVELIRRRIASLGISRRFYSTDGPLEGGWSMVREADGWWSVYCVDEGVRKDESRFPIVAEAGAHLIGCLTLTLERFLRTPEEELADYECMIRPSEVDPPLTAFDRKTVFMLPAGAEVDRFGPSEGNTVFVAGTTLPQRSMPVHAPPGEYRRFRVTTGFEVVSAVVRPDHGQVGGGTAYFLPLTVADLVRDGWLAPV
ncbi:TNT domain-containing protein [Saccharopolyspora erythraea]|uniref:TNT domain-containing protein n=1 Tax=Saccharopolyspora erythraea TaxID=1836 RepID=UPI001BA9DF1F|nr:TNT domain-containing protein [Saccharopolyspora erythraea]QUH05200.1 TNT domain-containing protein [Saccharopolyspora erythraea]